MEQSEVFRSAVSRIKALEYRFEACTKAVKECEESGAQAEKQVVEHFEKCFTALATRKSVLLESIKQLVSSQKQKVEAKQSKLEATIEAGKQSMKGGHILQEVDPNAANIIWKGLAALAVPQIEKVTITTILPITFLDSIQTHGEVHTMHGLLQHRHSSPPNTLEMATFAKPEKVVAFVGSEPGNVNGNGLKASLNCPRGICFNQLDECLYISDENNNSIRKVTLQGAVSTFAIGLNRPLGIAVNYSENTLFVTNESSNTISKISSQGVVQAFAGSGKPGSEDGVGINASFNHPAGIAIDQNTGNMFVCDNNNNSIRKITVQGEVTTLAGFQQGFKDGNQNKAMFDHPYGICFDSISDSLVVCDCSNNKLRQVQLNGEVSTLCTINRPTCVQMTANHTFIVSASQHKLFKVARNKESRKYEVTLLAGLEIPGKEDGKPEVCKFNRPRGIAIHEPSHSCFVVDRSNHSIRKISFC